MDNISKHITYNEATNSYLAKKLGINNTPNAEQLINMNAVAINVFEPIREHFELKIYIASFFRSSALNGAINGSSSTSQHMTGQAIDIDADTYGSITNKEIFDYIKDNLDFDQLIAEGVDLAGNIDWVHVSYNNSKNRKSVLLMERTSAGPKYYKYDSKKDLHLCSYR